ncbi:hypothetical protein LPJ66_005614 [Kickxella alabastrina]|uniref:Uncharacterized protein n=1 Tax=Kickxella alabastrina TaxID=61397 RepID=A0ACC1II18_9FUNG|nr:hypothetical protein LPJ66_005614 [Kickxella alabastrina]
MNHTASKGHRTYTASTIGTDLSIKYPYAFTHMSISPYGRDVVLAGQAGLAVIDLEFPMFPPRTLPLDSKWKIAGVAWCPSVQYHGWVSTPFSQTLLVHDLAHTTTDPMRVIRAHPTAITDVAWAPKIPAWVGTSSIDSVIKIWDVRRDQKPVWYFSKWEPADLLAFNNVHMHKMASAHRNKIAIWDIRYGSNPLMTMDDAHADDIISISWHPEREDLIVSAGLDRTIKRWNFKYGSPTEDYAHTFAHGVVSAKYLPFGDGILVTQKSPDNIVLVIKDSPQMTPVHEFFGHTGTVLASEWRVYGKSNADNSADSRDYQLVTWGQDRVMRMWAANVRLVESVGGDVGRVAQDARELAPSFATNFLGPDKILHLFEQKTLPSELMLAAAGELGSQKITTMHEFDRTGNVFGSIWPADSLGAPKETVLSAQSQLTDDTAAAAAAATRASTTDDHSSDDDDDDSDHPSAASASGRHGGAASKWREEVSVVVNKRYSNPKTVTLKDLTPRTRQCRLTVGVPWITRETVVLCVTFPAHYPSFPADFRVESVGAVFGSRKSIADHLASKANLCSEQGVGSLDHCLYSLLKLLVPRARAKGASHSGRSGNIKAEDLERLPPPPPKLLWETLDGRAGRREVANSGAALGQAPGKVSYAAAAAKANNGLSRSRSRSPKLEGGGASTQRADPRSLTSEDNVSVLSHDGEDYLNSDDGRHGHDYFAKEDENSSSGGGGGSSQGSEDDDDEDFDALAYDNNISEDLYDSDISQSDMPIGLDGLPLIMRNGNNPERFNAKIPFPRMCGGVFSGPGKLVCFFASMYKPDTYPEQSGSGQQGNPSREKTREDMCQQLRIIPKPRNLVKLDYYQSMVMFGLQNKGTYYAYGGNGGAGITDEPTRMSRGNNGSGQGGRSSSPSGFGESDDDGEARDEEVPRFYFRKQISHNRFADSDSEGSDGHSMYFRSATMPRIETGVGNIALLCEVSEDRSANLNLAKLFELRGTTEEICKHNASVAALNERHSLAHIWSMLACLLGSPMGEKADCGVDRLWITHPPVLEWIRSAMIHYERRGDVQTLALLSCVLSKALAEVAASAGRGGASEDAQHGLDGDDGEYGETNAIFDNSGLADLPPWMATANGNGRASFWRASAARRKCQGGVGWDILGSTAAEAVATTTQQMRTASRGDRNPLLSTLPLVAAQQSGGGNSGNIGGQHDVAFVVPPPPAAAVAAAAVAAAATAVTAIAAVDNSAPSIASTTVDTVGTRAAAAIPETLNIAAVESLLGRRITSGEEIQRLSVFLASNQLVPTASQTSEMPALPLSGGNGTGETTAEPMSPELLQELNSEEIMQNEIMMAEGLYDHEHDTPPTHEHTSDTEELTTGSNELHRTISEFHVGNGGTALDQRRNSSEQPNERNSAGPDGSENLWNRLRINVLGRVHPTAGVGKSGSLEAPMSPSPPPPVSAADKKQRKQAGAATKTEGNVDNETKDKTTSADDSAKQQKKQQEEWMMLRRWAPLLSGKRITEAQAMAKELSYLRVKRDFERAHTRLVMRDRSEWDDVSELVSGSKHRSHSAYLDHWKILYARILYKWQLNIKAVEVLKCVQDSSLRELYNQMYCQPTMPKHDNLPRISNPALADQCKKSHVCAVAVDVNVDVQASIEKAPSKCGAESTGSGVVAEVCGAPWLSCSWCHEYVHGRALICHACGHGGHHEHMQKWFRIVRKQLMRTGLTPAHFTCSDTANGSNSSSSSNLRRDLSIIGIDNRTVVQPGGASIDTGADVDASKDAQLDLAAAAHDYMSSYANSPVILASSRSGDTKSAVPIPSLTISSPGTPLADYDADNNDNCNSESCSNSGSSSSSSSSDDFTDGLALYTSSDLVGTNHFSFDTNSDGIVAGAQHSFESGEGESDDHLHPPHKFSLGIGSGDVASQQRISKQRQRQQLMAQLKQRGLDDNDQADGFTKQEDIPTCPSGCGCNCLYESQRLIIL